MALASYLSTWAVCDSSYAVLHMGGRLIELWDVAKFGRWSSLQPALGAINWNNFTLVWGMRARACGQDVANRKRNGGDSPWVNQPFS
jgi:hypothetical protein